MSSDPHLLARNLLLESELRRIVGALADRGIPSIVLKGIPLTLRLHGRIDGRESFDNDVLVHKVDAPKARDAMSSVGYASVDGRTIERQLEVDYQYRMVRHVGAAGLASAELHWNAFPPDLYPVDEGILWVHSETFDLGGKWVRVFDELLRLSAEHPVSVLLPVVGGLEEVRATRVFVKQLEDELTAEGKNFDPDVPIGAMIEVPSAAVVAAALAKEVDWSWKRNLVAKGRRKQIGFSPSCRASSRSTTFGSSLGKRPE